MEPRAHVILAFISSAAFGWCAFSFVAGIAEDDTKLVAMNAALMAANAMFAGRAFRCLARASKPTERSPR